MDQTGLQPAAGAAAVMDQVAANSAVQETVEQMIRDTIQETVQIIFLSPIRMIISMSPARVALTILSFTHQHFYLNSFLSGPKWRQRKFFQRKVPGHKQVRQEESIGSISERI